MLHAQQMRAMDELGKARQLLMETELLSESNPKLIKVCQKLSRKVKADVHFLEKLTSTPNKPLICNKSKQAPSSSNIPYLSGVLNVVKQSADVQDVICDMRKYGIIIDVICDAGKTWKKVIARNPQSLHLIWAGRGQYGTKDVVKKAEKYLSSAEKHSELSPPRVVCVFCNGVTRDMAEYLESLHIEVEGARIDVSQEVLDKLEGVFGESSSESDSEDSDYEQDSIATSRVPCVVENQQTSSSDLITSLQQMPAENKIYLDITTMLAYISDICNGGCHFEFVEKILAEQALAERKLSALSLIHSSMEGRRLVSCQSAVEDFWSIVKTLAGGDEKARAQSLMERLTVVSDRVSPRFGRLLVSGQIKERSKLIFGTADLVRCQILTSNEGFVRAAAAQGIHISSVLHQPRALSERKRIKATSISC